VAIKIIVVCAVLFVAEPALWLWMFTPAQRAPFVYLLQRLKR
jgi:hypothetical protein